MQDNPRELSLPLENSVYGYCGVCADKHSNANLHRIVEATGRRVEIVSEMPFKEMLFFEFHGSLQDRFSADNPVLKTQLSKVGTLRQIVRNAPREKTEEMIEVMRNREPFKSRDEVEKLAKEALGLRRADTSSAHLAKTIALRDSRGVFITCWRCKTKIRFSHEKLTLAVEHVQKHQGIIILRPTGIFVEETQRRFKSTVRRRRIRPTKPGGTLG